MIKRLFRKKLETRALPRLMLDNIIRYRLDSEPSNNYSVANVKNISASGILFVLKNELPHGKMLVMSINFPGMDPLDVKAQVARVKRAKSGDYEIGAHFIIMDEAKRLELKKRIDFILKNIAKHKSLWGQIKKVVSGQV